MSIESLTRQGENLLSSYKEKQDAISGNRTLSEQYKKERLNALFDEFLPRAETIAVKLWGAIESDPDGRKILSPAGEVWSTFSDLEGRVGRARQMFLEKRYTAPGMIEIIAGRAKTIVANARNAKDFVDAYTAAAPDVQAYLQDTAAVTITHTDREWAGVKARLERERATAEQAAVESAQNAVNNTVAAAYNGLLVSRAMANLFSRASYYLGEYEKGIFSRRYFPQTVDRRPFGVHFNNSRVHKVEVSSPWPMKGGNKS